MQRTAILLVLLVLPLFGFIRAQEARQDAWPPQAPAELRTVAESSDFKATSTHAQVIELMDRLAERSPHARRLSMGQTVEGREIPLVVFADPPVETPEAAARAREQGKLVVLLFGNIHGGEVDAKEALLMLARELARTEEEGAHPLLEDLVIAIAPIYNADGNEQFGPIERQRPGQAGPEEGAGRRHNAQDLDLNRDFVKLEAPETRALVRFMRQWDPAIVFDGHTTNGSLHRFLITYAGPKVPAGDPQVIEYGYETFLPALRDGLRERTGIDSFLYGNFAAEHTRWESFPAQARYGTNYVGLRNRLGVLSESYSYASYEDRIRGSLEFARQVLLAAAERKEEIRQLIREADARAMRGSERQIALRTEAAPLEEKGVILGFEEQRVEGQRRPVAGEEREYEVEVMDRWTPTVSVEQPFAYLLPPSLSNVVENLQHHGIMVEELREDIELDVTAYTLTGVTGDERPRIDAVAAESAPQRVEAGTIVVRTAQPLGALASYLLEPQSEDGLVVWRYFGEAVRQGEAFPVLRLEEATPLLTIGARPLEEDRTFGKRITYDLLYGGSGGGGRFGRGGGERPNFNGSPIGGLQWLDDAHYLQTKGRELHVVEAATGRSRPFHDPAAMANALARLPTIDERTAREMAGSSRFRFSDDFTAALIDHENDLYVYRFTDQQAVRLTSTPEPEELAEFSPDARFVAFVRSNDLYVVDVPTQTERALTTGGTDTLRHGKADWIYFEELFGRSWKAYWWSPDSSRIAFLRTDASMVDTFTLTDELREPLEVEVARYPKPGTPNPHVQLGIVTVAGGPVRWADVSQYTPDDFLISGVGWWPDSSVAYFFGQNREQTWMDLNIVGRSGGAITRLLRDETEAWVTPEGGPWVLDDGSFILSSDRSGWRHLYRFDRRGQLMNAVTEGEWDVRGVERIDRKNGVVYVNGAKDSHIATNLYRVAVDGSGIERLTTEPGSHSITMNEAGTLYIDSWSSRAQPTKVALFSTDVQTVRMLDTNPVYDIEEYAWGSDEQFQIETEDGFLLEATLVKPVDFDPARRYPIWITTYAGPYAPSIRDNWGGGRTWDQMLASEGIVVMRVDPRSASGKGPGSAWTAFRQLGVQETKDLEEAVEWLEEQPWADTSRVGLSGHSYGGYMTSYAMTHSDKFSAGIAGAPVTDWRDYDSIYTERYMGMPQNNPDGYARSSAVRAARNLRGELLLIHGSIDDNVHPQNTMRFVKALQDAARPFHMMIYPGSRHGIFGRHYNQMTFDFIRRTMGVDGAESSHAAPDTTAAGDEAPARRRARTGRRAGAASAGE